MAKIDKKFVQELLDKHPEIQRHKSLFSFSSREVNKVIAEGYKYVPEDPEPVLIDEKDSYIEIQLKGRKYKSFSDAFSGIEDRIKESIEKEYGVLSDNICDIQFETSGSHLKCTFTHSRYETKVEVAQRMIKDAEAKSLFGISKYIQDMYNKRIQVQIYELEKAEEVRLAAEREEFEKRKQVLINQMK